MKTSGDGFGIWPTDWSRNGRFLSLTAISSGSLDLWYMSMNGDMEPKLFLQTSFNEWVGAISPDGAYLAYQSNASGQNEVYVMPFPDGGSQWQVSSDGGTQPRWNGRGDELFFLQDRTMMAVPVTTGDTFQPGVPVPLFDWNETGNERWYDVTADGQRFVMLQRPEEAQVTPTLTVVENWVREFPGQE